MFGFVEINDIYCHRLGALSFNRTGYTSVYALFPVSKHTYDEVNELYARNTFSLRSRLEPIYHPTSANDGVLILALFDHGAHLCEDHKIDLCITLPNGVVNPCISDLMVHDDIGSPDYATQQLMRRAAEATRIDGLDRYERTRKMPADTDLAQWPTHAPVKNEKTIGDVLDGLTAEQKKVVCYLIGATEEKVTMRLTKRPIHALIKKVIFSGPVTLVYWTDGGMTKVRRAKGERDDKEKAIGMALLKHLNGEKASYISHLGKIIDGAKVVKPKRKKKDDGGSGDDA